MREHRNRTTMDHDDFHTTERIGVEATHRAAVTSRKDASAALLCGFSDFPRGDVRRKPHRFSPSYRLSCRFDSCRSDQNPELPDTNRHAHSLRYARTAETRNRRRQNTRRPDPQSARQSAEESGPPHGRLYAKGDQDDLRIRSGRNPAHQKRNGHPEAGRTRPGGHYFRADQSRSAALAGQAGNRSRRLPGRLERLERLEPTRPCAKSPERELLDPLRFSAPKPTPLRAVSISAHSRHGGRVRSTLAGFARPVENARRPAVSYAPAENLR